MEIQYDIPIFEIKREFINKPKDNGKYVVYIEKKENNLYRNYNKKENNKKYDKKKA